MHEQLEFCPILESQIISAENEMIFSDTWDETWKTYKNTALVAQM